MNSKEILKELVAINTIADKDNKGIMDYIENYLRGYGFSIRRLKNAENGKEVLVGTFGEAPVLAFLGHTDTVDITEGWVTDPLELTEKDGILYGLGACDMKGGIAAALAAIAKADFEKIKASGKGLSVYATYDEEIMFGGVYDLVAAKENFPDHVVVCEPTDLIPMIGSKGLHEFIFTFNGTTTHSSMPIDGMSSNKNAVRFLNKMMDFEEELRKERTPLFGVPYPTMNIGIVDGGTSINKVPDKTTVYLDFRTCQTDKEMPKIIKAIEENLAEFNGEGKAGASYVVLNDIASFISKSTLADFFIELTGKEGKPFFGITEASFFEGDRIIIGPGPLTAHEANEHISLESLEKTEEYYLKTIEKLCY